ncbi:MAG: adenylate/guanylate cyclase domain-containing protein [Salinimicrobium sp.]
MNSLRFYFTLILFIFSQGVYCQIVSRIDSLKKDLNANPSIEEQVNLLDQISSTEDTPDSVVKYANLLLEKSKITADKKIERLAYYRLGTSKRRLAEFQEGLQYLFKSLQLAEETGNAELIGITNVEIGNLYSESGNFDLATVYYGTGFPQIRKGEDKVMLGKSLFNAGDNLYDGRKMDSALAYTKEALEIFEKNKKPYYAAYALGNLGRINLKLGNLEEVEEDLKKAIAALEKESDYNGLADYYFAMAEYYIIQEEYEAAIEFAQKSLYAAEQDRMRKEKSYAHLLLSQLFEKTGPADSSYVHYKTYVAIRDSVSNLKTIQEMANLRSSFEISQKQKQVDLLSEQKKNQRTIVIATIVALVLILLIAFGLYRRNKFIGRTKKIIEREKNRSELLLLNILPQETAAELKEKGKVAAKRFDSVSILFTDFKNFTHYAENLSPEELVKSVDFYFTEFDRIVEKYGLEKIKTVGDSYMCAAGVPFPTQDHAVKIVSAACEMMDFVKRTRQVESQQETRFEVRIGINSGPVVAGVVGSKKWAYDIWGDSVNIASRMETTAETGHINISEFTYEQVKDKFDCSFRGEVHVKNKGRMKMYYVKCKKLSPKPANIPTT